MVVGVTVAVVTVPVVTVAVVTVAVVTVADTDDRCQHHRQTWLRRWARHTDRDIVVTLISRFGPCCSVSQKRGRRNVGNNNRSDEIDSLPAALELINTVDDPEHKVAFLKDVVSTLVEEVLELRKKVAELGG